MNKGNLVWMVLLDLQKALEIVDHDILLIVAGESIDFYKFSGETKKTDIICWEWPKATQNFSLCKHLHKCSYLKEINEIL